MILKAKNITIKIPTKQFNKEHSSNQTNLPEKRELVQETKRSNTKNRKSYKWQKEIHLNDKIVFLMVNLAPLYQSDNFYAYTRTEKRDESEAKQDK